MYGPAHSLCLLDKGDQLVCFAVRQLVRVRHSCFHRRLFAQKYLDNCPYQSESAALLDESASNVAQQTGIASLRYPNLIIDLVVSYSAEVWMWDMNYIRLGKRCVYLAIVMDVFTRAIRGGTSRSRSPKILPWNP
jgi:transposase InsO family protein